jgi:RNA polymerase sigma-70 factor (ECF subfamily)
MLRDHERALDLSQEVLLAAYRGLGRFDGRCSLGTWIFVIVRNRCLNELARPRLLWDPEVEPDDCTTPTEDPERALLDREEEEAVLALIRRHLDPQEQKALWMRCFERMPVDAITVALDLRERSGARAVLQRARRKLRAALAQREGKPGGESWTSAAS